MKFKIYAAIVVIFFSISGIFLIGKTGFNTLSGLRAYVGGESLWTRSQKEATYQLIQYIFTKDKSRYQLFVDGLKIPLGDKVARLELYKTNPDNDIISQGFKDGGNHPEDIQTMIFLYKYFKNLDPVTKAIDQWKIGDKLIEELIEIGDEIYGKIANMGMTHEQLTHTLMTIDDLQKQLSEAEYLFSYNMSSAARWAENLFFIIMLLFTIIGSVLCVIMMRLITNIISDLHKKNKQLEVQSENEKSLRKEIKTSEKKYRAIIENAVEGFFQSTPEGKFISVNPSLAKMFGHESSEELIHDTFDIANQFYTNPEDRKRYQQLLEKSGYVENYEFKARCKDGSELWVSNSTRAFRDKKGKIIRYEGTVKDITERKQIEEELRISEEHYREYFEENISGSYISSPEGQLIACNEEYRKIFRFDSLKHALDTPVTNFYNDSNERINFLNIIKKEKRVTGFEIKLMRPDGTHVHLVENASGVFDEDGNLKHIRGFLLDVTEQRKLEVQLQQTQKMESIGTLAGGIAHDFNNILFPILGHTEMLLMDIPEDSPFQNNMKAIHTSALRAKELVKQILTFSRQDVSELQLIKMQPIVKEALKLIRSTIPTTIEIKQDINPDCGVIKADPTQIHQIVMNLTTNAYHAMEEEGGELKVSLKQIKLETLDLMNPKMEPGTYACLIVADTGVGMDKNVTNKIFDPFFTTKEIGKGTGMGLSVVHGIITKMGGAVQVYSEQGKGTEFHVYFPIEKKLLKKQAAHSKTQIQGGTEQIFLVDDEEAILTMEKKMLERLGYQVTSRTSSVEALEAFRANPDKFDLVITDMAMPNMPGDKLSIELTKIRSDIPILLCSGFSETMSEEKATSLGIKGFLFKPIVMKDLAGKIREVLDEN